MLTHCCLCGSNNPTRKYLPRKGVNAHYGLTLCDQCAERYEREPASKLRASIAGDKGALQVFLIFLDRRGVGYITL